MGLITEFDESIEGYEAVPLLSPAFLAGAPGCGGFVLRRRTARPSRRAVLYVHALDDDFAASEQVAWYTGRGFHFYAADLRSVGADRFAPVTERLVPGWPQDASPAASPGQGAGPAPGAGAAAGASGGSGRGGPDPGARAAGQAGATGGAGGGEAAEPSVWDTATFDAIRFDQAVLDREAFRRAALNGPGRRRVIPAPRAGDAADSAAPPSGGPDRPGGPGRAGSRRGLPGPDPLAGRRPGPGQHRALPADVTTAVEELGECFACLDAAFDHLREREAIDTVVVAAHSAGALIAALWVHARRGIRPVDALILAGPVLEGRSWLARMRLAREENASGGRASPLLTSARRRVRRGLDIACPVLVMCPAGGAEGQGGRRFGSRFRIGDRAPARLGAHVTWLSMEAGLPGQRPASGPERRRYFEELTRWLGAYLSGQIRDQLL